MKKCTKCGIEKPLFEFHKNKNKNDGVASECKICCKLRHQKYYLDNKNHIIKKSSIWAKNNPDKKKKISRKSHLIKNYNIDLETQNFLIKLQNNKCKICHKELKNFHVDHSHITGKVRAILCHHCNVLLGNAKDSIDILKSAVDYLKKYNEKLD
jgi:hypothetical protein